MELIYTVNPSDPISPLSPLSPFGPCIQEWIKPLIKTLSTDYQHIMKHAHTQTMSLLWKIIFIISVVNFIGKSKILTSRWSRDEIKTDTFLRNHKVFLIPVWNSHRCEFSHVNTSPQIAKCILFVNNKINLHLVHLTHFFLPHHSDPCHPERNGKARYTGDE